MEIKPIESITLFQIDGGARPSGLVIERLDLSAEYDEYLLVHGDKFHLSFFEINGQRMTCVAPKIAEQSEALKMAARLKYGAV